MVSSIFGLALCGKSLAGSWGARFMFIPLSFVAFLLSMVVRIPDGDAAVAGPGWYLSDFALCAVATTLILIVGLPWHCGVAAARPALPGWCLVLFLAGVGSWVLRGRLQR